MFLAFLAVQFMQKTLSISDKIGNRYLETKNLITNESRYNALQILKDEEENIFYIIRPEGIVFNNSFIISATSELPDEVVKQMMQYAYYGYGYENHEAKEYYYATQFLIMSVIKNYETSFSDGAKEDKNLFLNEREEIKRLVEQQDRKYPNRISVSEQKIITDSYLIQHFWVEGDFVKTIYEPDRIILQFLENQEKYVLNFKAKQPCSKQLIWKKGNAVDFIEKGPICENDFIIEAYKEKTIEEEKEEIKPIVPDESVILSEEIEFVDSIEAEIPSTSSYSYFPIFFLGLLGNVYYVFKK